jgi:hypothetical protein
MADSVASKMSSSKTNPTNTGQRNSVPKKGEKYRCGECGMEIQVTGECGCKSADHVHFQCCNKEMAQA